MTVKERLHQLIEGLPEDRLVTAERLLAELHAEGDDPLVRRLLEAPIDDEPVTAEDRATLAESEADLAAGRVVPHPEARRRLLGG